MVSVSRNDSFIANFLLTVVQTNVKKSFKIFRRHNVLNLRCFLVFFLFTN